jgi:7-cyano-7-deazaguanine synthase in queuosine biosynthesis
MKTISIAGMNFDIHEGRNAISLSGGADSAILLYILMKNYDGPIDVIVCTEPRLPNRLAPRYATEVVHKCIELTGNSNVTIHTFFVKEKTFDSWFNGLVVMFEKIGSSTLYTGVTAFPDEQSLATFNSYDDDKHKLKEVLSKRDPTIERPVYYREGKIYTPMFNIDKRKVAELYKELNVLESLYPHTRSCESPTLTEGHCGECWWCEERHWAFGRLQ